MGKKILRSATGDKGHSEWLQKRGRVTIQPRKLKI
jgi:hypothetical protein